MSVPSTSRGLWGDVEDEGDDRVALELARLARERQARLTLPSPPEQARRDRELVLAAAAAEAAAILASAPAAASRETHSTGLLVARPLRHRDEDDDDDPVARDIERAEAARLARVRERERQEASLARQIDAARAARDAAVPDVVAVDDAGMRRLMIQGIQSASVNVSIVVQEAALARAGRDPLDAHETEAHEERVRRFKNTGAESDQDVARALLSSMIVARQRTLVAMKEAERRKAAAAAQQQRDLLLRRMSDVGRARQPMLHQPPPFIPPPRPMPDGPGVNLLPAKLAHAARADEPPAKHRRTNAALDSALELLALLDASASRTQQAQQELDEFDAEQRRHQAERAASDARFGAALAGYNARATWGQLQAALNLQRLDAIEARVVFNLRNNSVVCYQNVCVQALMSVPEFRFQFAQRRANARPPVFALAGREMPPMTASAQHSGGGVALAMLDLALDFTMPDPAIPNDEIAAARASDADRHMMDLRQALSHFGHESIARFGARMQVEQDAEEFYNGLIDGLRMETVVDGDRSFLDDIVFARTREELTPCPTCRVVTAAREIRESYLSLTFPNSSNNATTLPALLEGYFRPDPKVERTCDTVGCAGRGVTTMRAKRAEITHLPTMLVLHLRRTAWVDEQGATKVVAPVAIPVNLVMRAGHNYRLAAMVHHFGDPGSGHYTVTARVDDRWLHFDDTAPGGALDVRSVGMSEVVQEFVSESATLLFYERANPLAPPRRRQAMPSPAPPPSAPPAQFNICFHAPSVDLREQHIDLSDLALLAGAHLLRRHGVFSNSQVAEVEAALARCDAAMGNPDAFAAARRPVQALLDQAGRAVRVAPYPRAGAAGTEVCHLVVAMHRVGSRLVAPTVRGEIIDTVRGADPARFATRPPLVLVALYSHKGNPMRLDATNILRDAPELMNLAGSLSLRLEDGPDSSMRFAVSDGGVTPALKDHTRNAETIARVLDENYARGAARPPPPVSQRPSRPFKVMFIEGSGMSRTAVPTNVDVTDLVTLIGTYVLRLQGEIGDDAVDAVKAALLTHGPQSVSSSTPLEAEGIMQRANGAVQLLRGKPGPENTYDLVVLMLEHDSRRSKEDVIGAIVVLMNSPFAAAAALQPPPFVFAAFRREGGGVPYPLGTKEVASYNIGDEIVANYRGTCAFDADGGVYRIAARAPAKGASAMNMKTALVIAGALMGAT